MRRFALSFLVMLAIVPAACDDPFAADDVRFYRSVATGGEHSCAVATDGSAWCWGKGTDGELGIGVKENRATPARVSTDVKFQQITAGLNHTCALAVDGTAYCWGWNAFFERGNVTDARDAEPVVVETNVKFRSISAGDDHTCAIAVDGTAYCWGANQYGQLGDGTTRTRAQPLPVSGNLKFMEITAGSTHTCGLLLNGSGYCWGGNNLGQLGIGTTSARQVTPAALSTSVQFRQIDAGALHTCAVAQDFRFYCWGGNEFGELGLGGATPAGQPGATIPHTISEFGHSGVFVSAGEHHTCAIGLGDITRCWGRGQYGQLGLGSNNDSYHPNPVFLQPRGQHVADLLIFEYLAAGGTTHACGLAEQQLYCWGTGNFGELGVASSKYATMPQRVDN